MSTFPPARSRYAASGTVVPEVRSRLKLFVLEHLVPCGCGVSSLQTLPKQSIGEFFAFFLLVLSLTVAPGGKRLPIMSQYTSPPHASSCIIGTFLHALSCFLAASSLQPVRLSGLVPLHVTSFGKSRLPVTYLLCRIRSSFWGQPCFCCLPCPLFPLCLFVLLLRLFALCSYLASMPPYPLTEATFNSSTKATRYQNIVFFHQPNLPTSSFLPS